MNGVKRHRWRRHYMTTSSGPNGESGMLRREQSKAIRETLKSTIKAQGMLRFEVARLLWEVKRKRYWKNWGYPSFRSCVTQEWEFSLRTAQELIKVHTVLVNRLRLPPDRLCQLGWSKAALVAQIITEINADEVV